MKLSKYEQETIICYNEEEATASVYTHSNQLIIQPHDMIQYDEVLL